MSYQFQHTVETSAPSHRIWEIWTDVQNWPQWDTELLSATLEGSFMLGANGILKPRKGPASTFVISQLEAGQSYTFATKLPLGELKVKRFLVESEGKRSFTHEVALEGFSSALFGVVLGRGFQYALPKVMENIKKMAEQSVL